MLSVCLIFIFTFLSVFLFLFDCLFSELTSFFLVFHGNRIAPKVTVVNMYGTTETSRAVSYLALPNDASIETRKEIIPSGQASDLLAQYLPGLPSVYCSQAILRPDNLFLTTSLGYARLSDLGPERHP